MTLAEFACAAGLAVALSGTTAHASSPPPPAIRAAHEDTALRQAVDSTDRQAARKARDLYRHPYESLRFWGLRPGMTIVEVEPASGWWTDILAPYALKTGGAFVAGTFDLDDPNLSDGARRARATYQANYSDTRRYGRVTLVNLGMVSGLAAPSGSADFVLVARAFHNWAVVPNQTDRYLSEFYRVLKPGGILAVEQHRAAPGSDPQAGNGYVPESYVIEAAVRAGFVLEDRSELNANPKDTKDHPFGVWTLSPDRQSAPPGKPIAAGFDRTKYDAIGESDRMTLRFRKPSKRHAE